MTTVLVVLGLLRAASGLLPVATRLQRRGAWCRSSDPRIPRSSGGGLVVCGGGQSSSFSDSSQEESSEASRSDVSNVPRRFGKSKLSESLSTRPTWLRPKTMAAKGKAWAADRIQRGGQTEKPLKIALLVEPTPFTHVCGYANRFQEMLKYLKEFGDSVEIATPDDKSEAPREFLGFPITTLKGARLPLYPDVCLTMDVRGSARKMVENFRPDVIHVSTPGFLSMAAAAYAKAFKIPLVMSYHTHLPIYAERYMGWVPFSRSGSWQYIKTLHSFADLTLVTSPQMLEEFHDQSIKRVAVWKKGVDIDIFNPKHRDQHTRRNVLMKKKHHDKKEAFDDDSSSNNNNKNGGVVLAKEEDTILLYVGRLSVEKRLDELEKVLETTPDSVKLAFVGGGPHEAALRRLFARFGDRVNFCGVLRGEALSKAYASADVFVMPSDSETLGFVVIEAMASGLAVVAARAGGIPSIVDDQKNGILAPPRDPKAFALAVNKLLHDNEKQNRLKQQARKDAEQWGWKAATRHLRLKYKDAIQRHELIQRAEAQDKRHFFKMPFVSAVRRRALRIDRRALRKRLYFVTKVILNKFQKRTLFFRSLFTNFTRSFALTFFTSFGQQNNNFNNSSAKGATGGLSLGC